VALYFPDLGTGALGPAVYFNTELFTNSTLSSLPAEVAICLSVAAAPEIGVPSSRRRGRLFIGPLSQSMVTGAYPPRPVEARVADVADRGVGLMDSLGGVDLPMQVWSRTEGDIAQVARLWVDNEFDTVRSRGLEATARESRP